MGTNTPAAEAPQATDPGLEQSQAQTRMAATRTRDALERTLMSWIRTALSMIAYGFGLFKVLHHLMAAENGKQALHPASDLLAMAVVGLGTVLLLGATFQYSAAVRALQQEHRLLRRRSLTLFGAVGVGLVGLFAFGNLLLNVVGR